MPVDVDKITKEIQELTDAELAQVAEKIQHAPLMPKDFVGILSPLGQRLYTLGTARYETLEQIGEIREQHPDDAELLIQEAQCEEESHYLFGLLMAECRRSGCPLSDDESEIRISKGFHLYQKALPAEEHGETDENDRFFVSARAEPVHCNKPN